MLIYIQRTGENHGPYTRATVEQYIAEGSVSARDLAWHEGIESWLPLEEVLAAATQTPLTEPKPDLPGSTSVRQIPPLAKISDPAADVPDKDPILPKPLAVRMPSQETDHTRVEFLAALTFPFRQANWPTRFWWVPLVNYFPPLSWLIMRGWRVDIVRRAVREDVHPLPNGKDIGKFLAEGFVLMLMVLLYWLPLTVFMMIFGLSRLRTMLDVLWWAIQTFFTGDGTVSFWTLVLDVVTQLLITGIVPAIYWLLCYPIYRMAVLRFAITGRPIVFFQLLRNFRLFLRFASDMMLLFFLDFMIMRVVRWFLNALLIATGFGAILVPGISFPAYFWVTAHLFGQIAKKVVTDDLARA